MGEGSDGQRHSNPSPEYIEQSYYCAWKISVGHSTSLVGWNERGSKIRDLPHNHF